MGLGLRVLLSVLALAATSGAYAQTAAPIGDCAFDRTALSFAGDARTQTLCLLDIDPSVGDAAAPTLLSRAGRPFYFLRSEIAERLIAGGLPQDIAGSIMTPVSHTGADPERGVHAAYFVIHDTSFPRFDAQSFPDNLDTDEFVNTLRRFTGRRAVAHVFVNRRGEVLMGRDFSTGWRATKLEGAWGAGAVTRGRFLHIELVQPRRTEIDQPDQPISPVPGFTSAQYARLAQLYVLASARAGVWLIPALHARVDAGFEDAHDDPASFDLAAFDAAVAAVTDPPPMATAAP